MRKLLFFVLAMAALWAAPASAQQWIQVTSCNSPPRTLPPGANAVILVDRLGNICDTTTLGAITQVVSVNVLTTVPVSADVFNFSAVVSANILNFASAVSDNIIQWGSTNVINGGVAGSPGIGGNIATGTQATGRPVNIGGLGTNAEPIAVGNGQTQTGVFDLVGRIINFPYAQKENIVAGTVNLSNTIAQVLIATQSNFIYLTSASCFLASSQATGTTVSFTNGVAGNAFYVASLATPSGTTGFSATFPSPLGGSQVVSANTAIYARLGTLSAVNCNASGFKGT